MPEYDAKNVAFHVLSKEKSFQSVTFEDLQGKSESLRKEHKINEKDIIFICGESRFPYQFSLGSASLFFIKEINRCFKFIKTWK